MKAKDVLYILVIVLVIISIGAFLSKEERAKKADKIIKRLRNENHQLKTAYLSLFEKYLKTQQNINVGIIEEVAKLKENISLVSMEVHVELEKVIKRLDEGEGVDAIRLIAKIVEDQLKQKAKENPDFKKKPMLHNLLEFASKCEWISKRQFENGLLLKEVRNKESHELAVTEESRNVGLSIFAGIDIIYAIK